MGNMKSGLLRVLVSLSAVFLLSACAVVQDKEAELYRFWDDGNVGYMDAAGRVVIPATFHQGQDFYNGQAVVVVDAPEWAGQWAVIDTEGNFLIEPSNDHPVGFREGRWVMNRGGLHRYGGGTVWPGDEWFLADEQGQPVGDGAMYERLLSLQCGRAAVKVGAVWGYLDGDGAMAVAPRFMRGSYFHDGVAVMRSQEGYGAIDTQGEWVIPAVYDRMSLRFVGGLAFAVTGERWGVIDSTGNWLRTIDLPRPGMLGLNGDVARPKTPLPRWFRSAFRSAPIPYLLVSLAGRQSDYWVTADGELFSDGLLPIIRHGKLGYINEDLEIVIPCRFQHPDPEDIDYDDPWEYRTAFLDGVAPAMMDDQWGYIDRDGDWLVEPRFNQAYHFRGALALVVDSETVGYINRQGEYIWRVPLEETVSDNPDRHHHP